MTEPANRHSPLNTQHSTLAILALIVFCAASLAGFFYYRAPPLPPPFIDLAGIDPAIAAAVEEARSSVMRAPRSSTAWGRLGMVLTAHDFIAEGNVCFAQAESLDPLEPRWPYYQAAAQARGNPEAATPKFRRTVQLCGDSPDAPRLRYGEWLLGQGRLDEAEAEFHELLQRQPDHARALLDLGRVHSQQGNLDEASRLLDVARNHGAVKKAACLLLAEIHHRRGETQAAEIARRQAAELPDDPPWPDPFSEEIGQLRTGRQAAEERAGRWLRQGKIAEAINLLQETVRAYPESGWGWYLLGKALIERKEWTAAERALRTAARLTPEAPEVHFQLGIALFQRHDVQGAVAGFRKAVALKPDYASAHYNLGQCLNQLGQLEEALSSLRSAVRSQPDLIEARKALAELLLQHGAPAEAYAQLRQALELKPEDPAARQLMRRMASIIVVPF